MKDLGLRGRGFWVPSPLADETRGWHGGGGGGGRRGPLRGSQRLEDVAYVDHKGVLFVFKPASNQEVYVCLSLTESKTGLGAEWGGGADSYRTASMHRLWVQSCASPLEPGLPLTTLNEDLFPHGFYLCLRSGLTLEE
ncbi:unnamed protein product [Gadus morhua 'NCC']